MTCEVADSVLRARKSLSGVMVVAFSWSCAGFINSMKRFSKLKKLHKAGKCRETVGANWRTE